jgi:hypothetical protein
MTDECSRSLDTRRAHMTPIRVVIRCQATEELTQLTEPVSNATTASAHGTASSVRRSCSAAEGALSRPIRSPSP